MGILSDSKEGFVNDNLVNMRGHLKASREAILSGESPVHVVGKDDGAAKALARLKNDLRYRLTRDSAEVLKRIEAAQSELVSLNEIKSQFEVIDAELNQGDRDRKEIDALRFRYFRSEGELAALRTGGVPAPERETNPRRGFSEGLKDNLPLISAYLFGIGIVVFTLFFIFS